jgi:hypothetical protein
MFSITNPKLKRKVKKVPSLPQACFHMFFFDNPSSKPTIKASSLNPPSPRTIKNTQKNHIFSANLTSIKNAHHKSFGTINLQQSTHTHIHTSSTYQLTNILSSFAFGEMKHFTLYLHPRCFHLTPFHPTEVLVWPMLTQVWTESKIQFSFISWTFSKFPATKIH